MPSIASPARTRKEVIGIRILVADDNASWRLFISIIAKQLGWRIVGEASDGVEAVQKAQALNPDVIFLDIDLPKLNGINAARQILELAPGVKVLFVSGIDSPETVEEALSTNASGYVVKLDAGKDLVRAVESIFRDQRFLSSQLQ